MTRGSSKPCPGCGKVKLGRATKEVCRDCRFLLDRAIWLEEALSKMGDDEIVVAFGDHSHWNEYIYSHSGAGRNLMDDFQRVARAGSRQATTLIAEFELLGKVEGGGHSYAIMLRPLAEAVRDLRVAVSEALEKEYSKGKADGHNLLMRLADGDLSVNDFDKRIMSVDGA